MRADGLLLPIATIQSNAWRSLVVDRPGRGLRLTAAAMRLMPGGWRLTPAKGAPRAFSLTKSSVVPFECSNAEVFQTDLTSPKRLTGADTAKTLGLSAHGNITIERVADIATAADSGSRRIRDLVVSVVQALETERFGGLSGDPSLPFGPMRRFTLADRAKRPVRFRRLAHHKIGDTDWYYFETEKNYPEVGFGSFSAGWIAGRGAESHMSNIHSELGGVSIDNEVDPAEVLGVIPGRNPSEGATWVMSRRTTIDLVYTLYQVGVDDDYAVKRVLDVGANHCLP